ncbi:hypothetical protein K443DRAFT_10697 [Laccaria amethystina LaAM-08-1]|uniref:Cytochrome P450 n=1 Tax=Laccaria amethystina LaAM-08-1 TaxID=1095629 RepID=A0A0C9XFB5_9AGAR|nr:hypothetical protein K443DRAFT_10697 [Laccaria amethystina LaAM-08-1]
MLSLSVKQLLAFFPFLFLFSIVRRRNAQKKANPHGLPYPPGPKPLPVLGNLFDLARENESQAYLRLAHKYGDLVFLTVLGKNVLFVNSFKTANDLFEKRSSNYSDRAESQMVNLMGWDWSFGHMRYGYRWRSHRRMFHQYFQQSVAHTHWPVQKREVHALLRRLLDSPQNLINHLRHNAAAVIMGVVYGITVAPENDRYITIAEKALEGMSKAANPGEFLVDIIPILRYIPEWVLGAGFQRKAREWRAAVMEMRDAPYAVVQTALKEGKATPSFVTKMISELETQQNSEIQLEILKGCAGLAYAAGAESTVAMLSSFILAIVTHPEVQVKGQREIDSVVGRERLPDFNDRPFLPYITAIVKEVLRWNPVAPLGLPHMVTQDDEYNGYFIPAGTLVVGNTWAILHNPETFPEPTRFNPDRFMDTSIDGQQFSPMDPLSSAFGYGRRICPGRYMAEAQVWLSVACMLSVFHIGPGVERMGMPIKTTPAFSSGLICHPLPFDFSITPRGDYVKTLLEESKLEH